MTNPGSREEIPTPREVRFERGLFRFLKDLEANNERPWFQENKARYEAEARDPLLRFIGAFGGPLSRISRQFEADPRPVGGSMFRIYRDTRFAKDKTPYKTHLAAHFPHKGCGEGVHCPGFYLHLESGASFAGGGLWHPDPNTLFKVRTAIAAKPKAWKALRDSGLEIQGEALKRVPQGFDSAHAWGEDLKRKDFYIGTSFTDREVLSPEFFDLVTGACRQAAPLVAFICKAMEVAW